MKVLFIVSMFPCYDEAFILREMDAIAKDAEISIFSLKSPQDEVIHDAATTLLPKTVYTPYLFSRRILGAQLRTILRQPLQYFRVFFKLMFGNLKSPMFFFKSLAFFPKAISTACSR